MARPPAVATLAHPLRAEYQGGSLPDEEPWVGKHLSTFAVDVTPALLAEYAERTSAPPAAPPAAPATLLYAHAHREIASWYLPYLVGNLHIRQEWEFFSPARVGDRLLATRTVIDRYRTPSARDVVVCEVAVSREADGALVARSRTHQSFRPPKKGGARKGGARKGGAKGGGAPPAPAPPVAAGAEVLRGRPVLLDQAACDRYVGLSPDGVPLKTYHNDLRAARVLGFDRVVVQGTHNVCFINDLLERRFGDGWRRGGRLDLRFLAPVWLGDEVTACGAVREWVDEGAGRRRATCDVWLQKQDGSVAIAGTASAVADGAAAAPRL